MVLLGDKVLGEGVWDTYKNHPVLYFDDMGVFKPGFEDCLGNQELHRTKYLLPEILRVCWCDGCGHVWRKTPAHYKRKQIFTTLRKGENYVYNVGTTRPPSGQCITDFLKVNFYEANISTEKEKTSENPRVSCPYENSRRPQDGKAPTHEGPKETRSLTTPEGMISKKHRLSKEQFNAVYSRGVVLRSKHFLIRALFDTDDLRFAVAVGKKTEKTASGRNALRRKVFACLSSCVRDKKISHGAFVISVLTAILPAHTEMCDEICKSIRGTASK